MMMGDWIADTGERHEGGPPGLRPGRLDRRSFLFGSAAGLGALGLAGCATSDRVIPAEVAKLYGPAPDEKFPIPAVDLRMVDPKYYRQTVRYDTKEAPGTIIIDPGNYSRLPHRRRRKRHPLRRQCRALRVSVERRGLCGRKAEWPVWTPPKEMMQRQPEARKYAGGMPGGLGNPLGARTLHLYKERRLYGLHDLQHQRPRDHRNRRDERLHRPPQSGHDPPLRSNADQDEGGHTAGIAPAARRKLRRP